MITCTSSALPDSNDHDSNIRRNFIRLCTLCQTFARDDTESAKQVNTFWSPVSTTANDGFTSVLQIGDKRCSEFDRRGSPQHYCYSLQSLCYANSLVSSVNISFAAFSAQVLLRVPRREVPRAGSGPEKKDVHGIRDMMKQETHKNTCVE